jgi:hypothetical protein
MRAILILFKFILAIILLPLYLVVSVVSRILLHKQLAVTLQVEFASRSAYITARYGVGQQEAPNLIVAYILFLSQYFYACDKRQVQPVAKCFADHIESRASRYQIADSLLATIRKTLNIQEARAYEDLFRYPFLPPMIYTEGTATGRKEAKYTIATFRRGQNWSCHLRTSMWMNLILFPLAVGLLYQYVTDTVDEDEREILDTCLTQFLGELESSDYRSLREGANMVLANTVIARTLSSLDLQPAQEDGSSEAHNKT